MSFLASELIDNIYLSFVRLCHDCGCEASSKTGADNMLSLS